MICTSSYSPKIETISFRNKITVYIEENLAMTDDVTERLLKSYTSQIQFRLPRKLPSKYTKVGYIILLYRRSYEG